MNNKATHYKKQHQNAAFTLQNLKKLKEEIETKLEADPTSTNLHKDLRKVNLDIRITLNEIEHIESCLLSAETSTK